jgi:hypothetical protein
MQICIPEIILKGLDLAYEYYRQYGEALLWTWFPEYADRIACGLVGEGSECFGFDDEMSHDHDFGAGFCLWLTDEDAQLIAAELDARYAQLPESFMGYHKREVRRASDGARQAGVMRISDFYLRYTGLCRPPDTLREWLRIPEHLLAAAVNGRVFCDRLGRFTELREALLAHYPEDIRLRKLIFCAAEMAQAGQYNYARSLKRKERVAASFALNKFASAACHAAYLLNRRYMPFYKWAHRGLEGLPRLPELYGLIAEACGSADASALIECIAALIIAELRRQGISGGGSDFLLDHCGEMAAGITAPELRELNVFAEI